MMYTEEIEKVRRAYEEALADETYVNRYKAAENAAENMAFGLALDAYGYRPNMRYVKFIVKYRNEIAEYRDRLLSEAFK